MPVDRQGGGIGLSGAGAAAREAVLGAHLDIREVQANVPRRLAVALAGAAVVVSALVCGTCVSEGPREGDLVARLSIDLNDDGWQETVTVSKDKDDEVLLCARLARGTRNGETVDLVDSLAFQWLTGLGAFPTFDPDEPPMVVLSGAAGAHRSFITVYSLGKAKRFAKVLDVSGDGGAGLENRPDSGARVWVCERLYDTLQRCVTSYYEWDGSKFVNTRKEIGYHFDREFVYPREPETVAAAYVEAAALGVSKELESYIAKNTTAPERLRLCRLKDTLRTHFGGFADIMVVTTDRVATKGRGDGYRVTLTFFYDGRPSTDGAVLVQLIRSADGLWRVIDVEVIDKP